ncbi:hypothetical protein ACFFLS_18335 [Flavobacterium procerum]|uniref:DUF2785 domain-containing protein n=1 Tax=Flavobacterium procerum TaxID=1455569 RepID=A0ABV6BU90_9FLAO
MSNLSSIILPVIGDMEESHLKTQLLKYLPTHENEFSKIEKSFQQLTSKPQDNERLKRFFHSWSQTNNSAMTVAGISNRITMLVHKNKPIEDEKALLQAITSLNRIVDEDLAVVGRVLHSQLFYTMATDITRNDDWLSRRYLNESAYDFKKWKDQNSLRNKDIMIALLTTLIHEIYTHGEVEYILPKFEAWLTNDYGFSEEEREKTLAWISVHCGPTEKNHFFFAVSAIFHYAKAMNVDLESYDLGEIISDYLNKKATVMEDVMEVEEVSL